MGLFLGFQQAESKSEAPGVISIGQYVCQAVRIQVGLDSQIWEPLGRDVDPHWTRSFQEVSKTQVPHGPLHGWGVTYSCPALSAYRAG